MPGKKALVRFENCQPCGCPGGVCKAMLACKHKLIKQEKAGEIPLFPLGHCTGCGECVRACPQKAVQIFPA